MEVKGSVRGFWLLNWSSTDAHDAHDAAYSLVQEGSLATFLNPDPGAYPLF